LFEGPNSQAHYSQKLVGWLGGSSHENIAHQVSLKKLQRLLQCVSNILMHAPPPGRKQTKIALLKTHNLMLRSTQAPAMQITLTAAGSVTSFIKVP